MADENKYVYKKPKTKVKPFAVINYILFIIIGLIIVVPIWKVLIDSIDAKTSYAFNIIPEQFSMVGYKVILSTQALYRPFMVSVYTTIVGTIFGLVISTLGGYVLIQWNMPGRNAMAYFLLFTMIFSGGMIPEYLVMKNLGLLDSLWLIVFKHGVNVYNLVLMRNFFEGVPSSLFEAAEIDGCSPMGIFFKIVLPLSKAALASLGLMYAVAVWNDYTNFKIYITDSSKTNFQYKLRNLIMDGDMPTTTESVSQNTLNNAAIMAAIIPFLIVYPFCQKYFVQGVNIGAVKE